VPHEQRVMIRVVDPAIEEEVLDRVMRNLRSALSDPHIAHVELVGYDILPPVPGHFCLPPPGLANSRQVR
jgi:hypothetical protein